MQVITPSPGPLPDPSPDRTIDHSAGTRLDRLGIKTARRRGRKDKKVEEPRGLGTLAHVVVLLFLWMVNFPVALQTFQVFRMPMLFTVQLALAADAVFLLVAHRVGVTLRQAHEAVDPAIGLGVELYLGWSLFVLGIGGRSSQAGSAGNTSGRRREPALGSPARSSPP